MASRAYTGFFLDLTQLPSFRPNMTHFRTRPRFHQDKQSKLHDKLQDNPTEKVASRRTQGFSKI